jgi:PAS domain S-box
MSTANDLNFSSQVNRDLSGFAVVDGDGIVVEANEAFRDLCRSNIGGELIGKKISMLIPGLNKNNLITYGVFNVAIGEKQYYVIPSGLCGQCTDKFSKCTGLFFVNAKLNHELMNRLDYERTLSSELTEILEGSFDGILVTDKDGKILFVNSSYERVAEIKKSDMEGKSMKDLINPVWMPNSVAYIVAEQKTTVSKRQVVKSGRHIMVTGRPIFDDDGEIKMIIINARDITEIYDLSEELQKSKSTEKLYMERLSEFSDMSKDISPIVAVSKEMKKALSLAEKVANFQATVLILGESGVGKEEIAKFIHQGWRSS